MTTRKALLCVLLLLLGTPAWAQDAKELRVFAAAGMTAACKELGPRFEQEQPGLKVVWNFASSGALLHQLEQGAPAEVFLSADAKTVVRAEAGNLTAPGAGRIVARDVVVLATPAGNRARVQAVADLLRADVTHIGLGDPATTPLGAYVQEAMEQQGLWAALTPRLVLGQTMPEVMSWLKRGEVDAAFVFRSGVRQAQGAVEEIMLVPTPRSVEFIAVATLQQDPAAATAADVAAFLEFLSSKPARTILERHGFLLP